MELTITATQDHQHYVHFRRHLNYSTPFYRWVLESDPSWMLCQSIFMSGSTVLKDQNVWWANYIHTTKIWIAGHQMPSCCWCKPFHNNDCLYFSKDHVEEYMKEIAIRLGVFFFIYLYIPNHSWRFCPNKLLEILAYSPSFVPTPQFLQRVRCIASREKKRTRNWFQKASIAVPGLHNVVLARRTKKDMRRPRFTDNRRTTWKYINTDV